ncbi:2,3-dihydroxybenzoate-AMP ligase [Lentzea sp. NBRC 105346]|uniref:(2,3-dihydroxybenzoyl)adenylate synthase n=1 Tax=Lentzea sp. NBRC 105346 TaxID=3032205 RepID=UPI0024A5E7D2|nr:AMP-binding protein [Lentzea sp. NBRC 105346]GLZ28445.1 2,3-dihydroxybenzoate-AMP ligase [Lentzea sp. NBRC 105346]
MAFPSAAESVPAERAARYREEGWWLPERIGDLVLRDAPGRADRCAAVSGDRSLTYGELAAAVDRVTAHLRRIGIATGDRVLVQLPNDLEFLVLVLALIRLGAPPVVAMPALRQHELDHVITVTRPVAFAVPRYSDKFDHLGMAEDLSRRHPCVRTLLVAGHDRDDHVDIGELCWGPGDGAHDVAGIDPRHTALYLLSSGTTGPPKAIPRTHEAFGHVIRTSAEISALAPDTVYLALMPASHSFVFGHPGMLGTLACGGTVVFATPGDPRDALELVARERVSHCALVPALVSQWLSAAEESTCDLSSLRVLQVGGARLDASTAQRIHDVLGCRVQQVYGMSEGLLNFTRLDDPDEVVLDSQGRPSSPGDEVLVLDDEDRPVAPGGVGELVTRGPSVIAGYYADPETNARAFTPDGYYRTGDLVRRLPSGDYVVCGRIKDVINRGGEKIAADELEALLLAHPSVRQVAAVAMPHQLYGEAVCLYVVPAGDDRPRLPELRRFLGGRGLAAFKLPARVEFVDALPMKGVGKIDKVALRRRIADRVAAEQPTRA